MALKTFVLISTVNNLSDARYCAGMDVDFIGFSMEDQNKNYITPETYKELTEWLSGVDFIGEFESSDPDAISATLKEYDTNYAEVNNPRLVGPLKDKGLTVFLRQNINGIKLLDVIPDYLILESDEQTISKGHIDTIKSLTPAHNILLGFGLTDTNVEEVLKATQAHGIALRGGDEIKPGYKDYDELADILEALEIDDMDL